MKKGDKIYVSDRSEEFALKSKGEKVFLGMWEDWYLVEAEHGEGPIGYKYAVPIPVRYRMKKASEIMEWLEENEYKVNEEGDWKSLIHDLFFLADMWQYCGKEFEVKKVRAAKLYLEDTGCSVYEAWLEKIED